MKLSFSTKGWHNKSFEEFCNIAKELKFGGIELHNINGELFKNKDGAFHGYAAAATVRRLYEMKLELPCIDVISDISENTAIAETESCIKIAKDLHIPNIRIKSAECDNDTAKKFITAVLPKAEKAGVTLVIETSGAFCDTAALRELLDSFASDNLAALWDMYSTFFKAGEQPEETIKNLGAYVKQVHIKDFDGEGFCLIGEGKLPVGDMMSALRSVNYDGFISLEWDPAWCEGLDDSEIIFSHFVNFISQFGDTSKAESALYYNRARTGKYVWKKNLLIDETFSQVLDRMVEEFPDQYAFKYTTLDYTRTYSEFRDDVDEFCRSLIALGVKAGSHVAVWATNIPQWYIAFWAVTKIGAVLVSMNTAYKIHEAEYLLKQSDTHTLIMIDGYRDSNYSETMAELCPELESKKAGEPPAVFAQYYNRRV